MRKTEDDNRRSLHRKVRPMHRDHRQMLRALGVNIRAARLKTGITLPTMAKLSGVSKGNCSKIEHGGNVGALTLYKLCWAIGVHPRDVLPTYRPNKVSDGGPLTPELKQDANPPFAAPLG